MKKQHMTQNLRHLSFLHRYYNPLRSVDVYYSKPKFVKNIHLFCNPEH